MGCDIHLYIEYKRKKEANGNWIDFGGMINPGRNYYMFGLMAGVRSNVSLFEAKGLPGELHDLGSPALDDYYVYISEDANDGNDWVNLETAQRYAQYGKKILNGKDGKPTWVEHPDWHSASWLTTKEYKAVIDRWNEEKIIKWGEPEYEAVLAAMQKLEEFDMESRIVFWFDN